MPDGLSLADQEFFQGLAYIYARYRMKVIDRATGSREKGKLRHAYEQRKNLEEFQKKLADKRSKTLRETEVGYNQIPERADAGGCRHACRHN